MANLNLKHHHHRLAPEQLKPVDGLHDLCRWIEGRNLKRAAVTNAPRENAELMLSLLGLTDFFPVLVIGSECARAKPFPDPYLQGLNLIGASPQHTIIFEVRNLCVLFTYDAFNFIFAKNIC
jgi:beta-phosphoglucomutase-like phosphatase (HAD superfamily)